VVCRAVSLRGVGSVECAADPVDHVQGVGGFPVAAPGDVLVGSDEHEVAFVERVGVGVADVDDVQWHAASGGSAHESVDVVVGEPEQGAPRPRRSKIARPSAR